MKINVTIFPPGANAFKWEIDYDEENILQTASGTVLEYKSPYGLITDRLVIPSTFAYMKEYLP